MISNIVLLLGVCKVNQLYVYPLFFFSFFSHIGHYRVLSRVPCAIQYGRHIFLGEGSDMGIARTTHHPLVWQENTKLVSEKEPEAPNQNKFFVQPGMA